MQLQESPFKTDESAVQIDGAAPLWLRGAEQGWLVTAGKVDLFAVPLRDGNPTGAPRHLARAEAGQLLLGAEWEDSGEVLALLARGSIGSRMQELSLATLREMAAQPTLCPQVAAWVDGWVNGLSAALATAMPPKKYQPLLPGQEIALPDATVARPNEGVLWVQHLAGSSQFLAQPELPRIEGETPFPLSAQSWLYTVGESRLHALDSSQGLQAETLWPGLQHFHRQALLCLQAQLAETARAERVRLSQVAASDEQVVKRALLQLASVLERELAEQLVHDQREEPLVAACRVVGNALELQVRAPSASLAARAQRDPIGSIARASRIRVRRVALRGRWWQQDNGPLLAFREADRRPLALLPAGGRYQCYDPVEGSQSPLGPELAAALDPFAYTFFRSFPERAINAWELLRFGLRGSSRDLAMLLLMGVAMGFLALAPAIVTQVVFDSIIPAVNQFKLLQLTTALVVAAFAGALFQLVRSIATLRIETRMSSAVQAALWDRLLDLPVPFFRRYSSGDLAARVAGVDAIRQLLTGVTISTVITGLFSLFNFGLLFYYDPTLALIATGIVLVASAFAVGFSYLGLQSERTLNLIRSRLAGTVLQLVSGIAKLRVAGAERRAFARWAEAFTEQRTLAYRARIIATVLAVFNAAFPTVALILLFASIAASGPGSYSTGTVLAFITAFTSLLTATLSVSSTAPSLLRIIPLFEMVRPILELPPEVDTSKQDPGELSGAIEVNHLSFRYRADGPMILQDVSFRAEPGEFIALVGPSGSGKSTLLRLLLGFESPESGSIYYDGQDLAELDIQAIRRQVGVVLQSGKLMPGDIYTNIVGSSLLTIDDAWEAARLAGLDEDIRQMPMGMHTVISEAGSTFSGGQRQRLMIARAIVTRPRLLLFDEATSALDNRTQAIVSQSLEQLQATRIVIAHRLSTIINADRIYVMEAGRVVQSGSYAELADQEGAFRRLIQRQLV